jgi:hypothetical protein
MGRRSTAPLSRYFLHQQSDRNPCIPRLAAAVWFPAVEMSGPGQTLPIDNVETLLCLRSLPNGCVAVIAIDGWQRTSRPPSGSHATPHPSCCSCVGSLVLYDFRNGQGSAADGLISDQGVSPHLTCGRVLDRDRFGSSPHTAAPPAGEPLKIAPAFLTPARTVLNRTSSCSANCCSFRILN